MRSIHYFILFENCFFLDFLGGICWPYLGDLLFSSVSLLSIERLFDSFSLIQSSGWLWVDLFVGLIWRLRRWWWRRPLLVQSPHVIEIIYLRLCLAVFWKNQNTTLTTRLFLSPHSLVISLRLFQAQLDNNLEAVFNHSVARLLSRFKRNLLFLFSPPTHIESLLSFFPLITNFKSNSISKVVYIYIDRESWFTFFSLVYLVLPPSWLYSVLILWNKKRGQKRNPIFPS